MSTQYLRFSAGTAQHRQRSALLERLLAGADGAQTVADWREAAFGVIAPQAPHLPGFGAAALHAELGAVADAWVMLATPVHYTVEISNVRLAPHGILTLSAAEAELLAKDFNRLWHDSGLRLVNGRDGCLYCLADRPLVATTRDPQDVLDQHIDKFLPSGADAARLRGLMSEMEMWLFEHAVNRQRAAEGIVAVNGLWLWGGGVPLTLAPPVMGWTEGNDPFFQAFAGAPAHAADAQLTHAGRSGVVVLASTPGTLAWHEAETRWLKPAVEGLKDGRLSNLELSAGARSVSVSARWRLRFWRRRRPWWEWYA